MSVRAWSFVLQWSRVGIGAVVFLIAARYLTLAEIGLFATAFAPIRLTQGLHKVGVSETTILVAHRPGRLDAVFSLSLAIGLLLSVTLAAIGWLFGQPMLMAMAILPVINALAAVPDGLLRHRLRLRALALRTVLCQSCAAAVALWLLAAGAGPWALTAFALLNGCLAALLTVILAKWRPAGWANLKRQALVWPGFVQIALRDLATSALLPLIQLAVAACLGLPAAGAFQIAARLLSLIDAVALSPLRFIALPQLRHSLGSDFPGVLRAHIRGTARLSCWIWGGALATAPTLVTLTIGAGHAEAVAPVLRSLALFGLTSALLMPVNQALTATGHTGLVLGRAARLLIASLICAVPALLVSPTWVGAALSVAAVVTACWYLPRAARCLPVTHADARPVACALAAGAVAAVVLTLGQTAITGLPPLPAMTVNVALGTLVYAAALVTLGYRHNREAVA